MAKTSEKIENEFILAIKNADNGDCNGKYQCIAAGYDSTCSVGKKMAFPGSDLDKAFVIIRGSDSDNENIEIVTEFKKRLWEKTDQRILSFNHDTSFPNVYTVKQVEKMFDSIDSRTSSLNFNKNRILINMENECFDLEKAGEYNILISKYFPKKALSYNPIEPNKENVKNFAFFVEGVRDGKFLISTPIFDKLNNKIKDYEFYKFINVAHIKGMKNKNKRGEVKQKLVLRQALEKEFKNWDVNKQFEFIKVLIKASCEDNKEKSEYFKNTIDMKSKYKDFLALLTLGTDELLFQPLFETKDNALIMEYGKNKKVYLYQGHSDKILWINSGEKSAIEETLRNIDKIKLHPHFNNVVAIQYPYDGTLVDGFLETEFKTADGEIICGKRI